jgi:hypothetical protein
MQIVEVGKKDLNISQAKAPKNKGSSKITTACTFQIRRDPGATSVNIMWEHILMAPPVHAF